MKKMKQIVAILGVILLLGLYVLTFVMAIIDPTETMQYFMASVVATVMIPALMWIYMYIYKLIKKNNDDESEPKQEKDL